MSKYRIKAYFMHETEQAKAKEAVDKAIITDAEWTDGYVMGVVDSSKIKSLSKNGLVISLVEEVASSGTETVATSASKSSKGRRATAAMVASTLSNAPLGNVAAQGTRPLPVTIDNRSAKSKVLSHDRWRMQFYVVRFHGTITKERRQELNKLRIKLIERLTHNKYTVQLKPSQAQTLSTLPFVDFLRLYTEEDTLRVKDSEATQPMASSAAKTQATASKAARPKRSQRTCIYTVRLHQAKDMPSVARWLAQRKHKPIWKRGDQLQVAMIENSKNLKDLANRPEVAIIEQIEAPRLYDEPARTLLGLVRNKTKLGLEGAGEIIGVADTGIDKTHADLANRIAGTSAWGRKGDVSDPEGHGTHVAGCIVGDGTASKGEVMGAAPKAKLFFQSILDANGGLGGLPDDIGDILKEAYNKGARIHNNSWGAFTFARYANTSLDVDRFVADHPDMLVIIAAGNDGIGIPRATGSTMTAKKGLVDWPCVASPATAKNALTVGASRSSRTSGGYAEMTWNDAWPDNYPDAPISKERISGNDQCLAAFSSRGPSGFMIKPDVVAPGTDIAATKSKDAPLHKFWGAYPKRSEYGFMGGTSMAAPYVAGCAALVREWYRTRGKWDTPSAALLKATLINGTQRIKGNDAIAELLGEPNFHQGFGRIDMANTVPSALSPKLKLLFVDSWKDKAEGFTAGKKKRYRVTVGNGLPLRIALAWTDPGANSLQNLLVLMVDTTASTTKWRGNEQAATLLNVSGGLPDPNNNVQVVRIEKPAPGEYTIMISAGTVLFPPQSFALVVSGDVKDLKPIV